MKPIWDIGPFYPKPVVGDYEGAELEVEVFERDGEKDYFVRCLCPACYHMENVGLDVDDLEVGTVYYMKSWLEEHRIFQGGTEYDGGIAIHENKKEEDSNE